MLPVFILSQSFILQWSLIESFSLFICSPKQGEGNSSENAGRKRFSGEVTGRNNIQRMHCPAHFST